MAVTGFKLLFPGSPTQSLTIGAISTPSTYALYTYICVVWTLCKQPLKWVVQHFQQELDTVAIVFFDLFDQLSSATYGHFFMVQIVAVSQATIWHRLGASPGVTLPVKD